LENGQLSATYIYDVNGDREKLINANGNSSEYKYNLGNKLTQLINKKGTATYVYDKNNRLTTETKAIAGDISNVTRYVCDNNGNQNYKGNETIKPAVAAATEAISMYIAGESTIDDASFYQYDGFNQLIKSIVGDKTLNYGYNSEGLRTSKTMNGAVTTQV